MEFKIYRLSEIEEATFRKWYQNADEERRFRISKFKNDQAKKQSLCADGLAREMLASGMPASAIRFRRSGHGKPEAVNSPLQFSLSHSGDFVLCAVSEAEIGADIEELHSVSPALIRRICTEEEKEFIGGDSSLFLQVWTAKEALAKLHGNGLSGDLKLLSVVQNGRLQIPDLRLYSELTAEYALSIVYKA